MYYIESACHDPMMNLALEQYVFEKLDRTKEYCMLWQNDNAIIVGKHQNTFAEINRQYVDKHGIRVVRRLSGGGCVYHDLGNINFTFIAMDGTNGSFNFSTFCRPIVNVLKQLGLEPEISGRNDITLDGKKFSGNSQYMRWGRVMHHGTIMFDSNLDVVQEALNVPKDKFSAKGFQSVRSRVTNVREHMEHPISTEEFFAVLRQFLTEEYQLVPYQLTEEDWHEVEAIRDEVYGTWEWNYGTSREYQVVKERRIDGCGKVEIHMDTDGGRISDIAFYGDYFGNGSSEELRQVLLGRRLMKEDLADALSGIRLSHFFANLAEEQFVKLVLE